MENLNIAQKILRGSSEIDRMKNEIEQLAAILIGALNKIRADLPKQDRSKGEPAIQFIYGIQYWTVGSTEYGLPFIDLEIRPWEGCRTVYSTQWKDTSMSAKFVKMIYDSLPRLVEGLMEKFPELQRILNPIIKASE